MSQLTQAPHYVNATHDTDLTVSQAFSGSSGGYVVIGPHFSNRTLTLDSSFAQDLYDEIGTPSLNYAYPIWFSIGNGNSFVLATNDDNIITTNSTTFEYNEGFFDLNISPLVFILTQVSPPQFTVYG
jgi:hypothetical protein